jgi:hypothetical protein
MVISDAQKPQAEELASTVVQALLTIMCLHCVLLLLLLLLLLRSLASSRTCR